MPLIWSFFKLIKFIIFPFRNEEIVKYFVSNGLKLNSKKLKNCILILVSVSKYIAEDSPIELLEILLNYGAEVNCYELKNF